MIRPMINCALFCEELWMAAPTHHKNEHKSNDALLPNGSDTNDEERDPKMDPSDMAAVMKPCMVDPGLWKYFKYGSCEMNAEIDEMSKPNIIPEMHEMEAMKYTLYVLGVLSKKFRNLSAGMTNLSSKAISESK